MNDDADFVVKEHRDEEIFLSSLLIRNNNNKSRNYKN